MSYYYGLTLPDSALLICDRMRSIYSGEQLIRNELSSKIFKIRDNLYLAGAGLLHFVDDIGDRAFPQIFQNPADLRLTDVKDGLDEIAGWLDQNYKQLVSTMADQMRGEALDPTPLLEQDTGLLLAGADATGKPFLIAFHSVEQFKPRLVEKAFEAHLPYLYPKGADLAYVTRLHERMQEAVKQRLRQLKGIKDRATQKAEAVKILPDVIAMAAAEDGSVSREFDLVVVRSQGAETYTATAAPL